MKTKLTSIAIGVFLYAQIAHSQDNSRVLAIVKTMPTTLFDIDNTVTFGVEVPFNKHWSIQQELGWGNTWLSPWYSERNTYPSKTNWRFRTQGRYYFDEFRNNGGRMYIGMEYFRKDVFVNQLKNIGRECTSQTATCSYFEEANVRTHRAISALHFKFGYQVAVSERVIIDTFAGFGGREIVVTNNVSAQDNLQNSFQGLFDIRSLNPSNRSSPSISFGFSVGYQIKKK
jgi:Protein of unknown function (DUF3575)